MTFGTAVLTLKFISIIILSTVVLSHATVNQFSKCLYFHPRLISYVFIFSSLRKFSETHLYFVFVTVTRHSSLNIIAYYTPFKSTKSVKGVHRLLSTSHPKRHPNIILNLHTSLHILSISRFSSIHLEPSRSKSTTYTFTPRPTTSTTG